MSFPRSRSKGAATATLVLFSITLLHGCTSGSGSGDAMSSVEAQGERAQSEEAQSEGAQSGAAQSRDTQSGDTAAGGDSVADAAPRAARNGAGRTTVRTRSVISTGEVSITSKNLDEVLAEAGDILDDLDGFVAQEETSADKQGNVDSSRLTVRLPATNFETAITSFEKLGTLEHSQTNSEDVTTKVIDVDVRVRAQEKALNRLEDILREGADLDEVIRLESEIAQRQAELDSLKSQQAYLADQTDLSTISLYLSTPETFVEEPGALEDAGFLAGLGGGWKALKIFLVAASTMAGAVIPFAVALTLVGVPLLLLARASARRRTAPVESAESSP